MTNNSWSKAKFYVWQIKTSVTIKNKYFPAKIRNSHHPISGIVTTRPWTHLTQIPSELLLHIAVKSRSCSVNFRDARPSHFTLLQQWWGGRLMFHWWRLWWWSQWFLVVLGLVPFCGSTIFGGMERIMLMVVRGCWWRGRGVQKVRLESRGFGLGVAFSSTLWGAH